MKHIVNGGYFSQQDITVISVYAAHIQQVKMDMNNHKLPHVKASTVRKYQGMQNKIIILCLVRDHSIQGEFILDSGQLNVALTRCTHANIVIGDAKVACLLGDD